MSKIKRVNGESFMKINTLGDCVELINVNTFRTWKHLDKIYGAIKKHDFKLRLVGLSLICLSTAAMMTWAENDELKKKIKETENEIEEIKDKCWRLGLCLDELKEEVAR